MRSFFFWALAVFLTLAGIRMVCGSIAVWNETVEFVAHASHAKGVVVSVIEGPFTSAHSRRWAPIVEFSPPDGRKIRFQGAPFAAEPFFKADQYVDVLYEAANPDNALVNSDSLLWTSPKAFGALGFVILTIGAIMLGLKLRKRHLRAWLARSGTRVQAAYQGALYEKNYDVFNRSPYRLLCRWEHPTTQKSYILRSDRIWFDPRPFVKRESLDLLINLDNPKQYYVDVTFLPAKA
jgi:Protein of unknown function (DUF3592)